MIWDQLCIRQDPESKKLGICAECFMIQMFSAGNHFNTLGLFWTTAHGNILFSLSLWLERACYQPCWLSTFTINMSNYFETVSLMLTFIGGNLPLQSSRVWIIVCVCCRSLVFWWWEFMVWILIWPCGGGVSGTRVMDPCRPASTYVPAPPHGERWSHGRSYSKSHEQTNRDPHGLHSWCGITSGDGWDIRTYTKKQMNELCLERNTSLASSWSTPGHHRLTVYVNTVSFH